MLAEKGITLPEELPQTSVSGVIAELHSAVLDGNSYVFVRLEGGNIFYSISAAENNVAVILNVGDTVTIGHAVPTEGSDILTGYSLVRDKRA